MCHSVYPLFRSLNGGIGGSVQRSHDSQQFFIGPADQQIPFDAADILFHPAQEVFCSDQIVMNSLAADALHLGDLAQGHILIVSHIQIFALFFRQHIAIGIKQQRNFKCVHSVPPPVKGHSLKPGVL